MELAKYGCTVNTISPGALTRLTIALRENRGGKVDEAELEANGPQQIAPVIAWLGSDAAKGISSQIFHIARGQVAIMQQPAIIKSFEKKAGAWTLAELDQYMPKLVEARKAHDEGLKQTAAPQTI